MFVACSKDFLYMLCVTAFYQLRIKRVCRDDRILRCNTILFGRWLPVFVATQCLHFQGWRVSYILKAGGFMFLWDVHTCLPNHMASHCVTPHRAFSLPWDVTSQIDEFIRQRPGDVRLLRCYLSSNNKKVHLVRMRLLKKHRPYFVMCCGRMALWTKWSWILANSKFSPTS